MGSKEGFAADKAGAAAEGKMLGGTANDGSSKNFAKEGSQLVEVLKEFPSKMQTEKLAHGSPFFWTEEKDGSKKKLTLVGGLSDLKEHTRANFADDKSVMRQDVEPMGWGMINMFNNYSPGYTTPSPLAEA